MRSKEFLDETSRREGFDCATRSSASGKITEKDRYDLPNGTWILYKDHVSKSWYGFKIDAEENQIGEALFAYRKRDLLNDIKTLPDTYGTDEY